MSKVKKAAMVAGVRNAKRRAVPTASRRGKTTAPRSAKPAVHFDIKELDPVRKCGPGTSVKHLYRVIERGQDHVETHLVFFDRHGWYCIHGPTCPAVAPARSHSRIR